eukprot:1146998-Pelagomonas_calceolata.AAC.1
MCRKLPGGNIAGRGAEKVLAGHQTVCIKERLNSQRWHEEEVPPTRHAVVENRKRRMQTSRSMAIRDGVLKVSCNPPDPHRPLSFLSSLSEGRKRKGNIAVPANTSRDERDT